MTVLMITPVCHLTKQVHKRKCDGQTEEQTEGQTDRWIDKQTG